VSPTPGLTPVSRQHGTVLFFVEYNIGAS
jgi:hypothetical protein